jgi:hypothetical protein
MECQYWESQGLILCSNEQCATCKTVQPTKEDVENNMMDITAWVNECSNEHCATCKTVQPTKENITDWVNKCIENFFLVNYQASEKDACVNECLEDFFLLK